ncbi:MAG: NifB/NifX family molybdenum-iron cluster-binding protein [Chloroflexota bacterium]|nr:NifB/NifX family molybdenum-iron cluster-binding protein [Chloroflexota bacterium]
MRYAVPITDDKMSAHFGHCQCFALIDADEAKGIILNKEVVSSPGHEPGLLPRWLAEQGVSVVIAGGMGSRAQNIFQENRIQVIIGVIEDDPDKAVLDHMIGALATGDNICDH